MSSVEYLYLIKTINENKIQLVTNINVVDGVVFYNGVICAVLKRYHMPALFGIIWLYKKQGRFNL